MPLENPRSLRAAGPPAAFTLMEILVVVSIILVLAAIALPVYSTIVRRSAKVVAISNMRQVTAALITYAGQNDGDFPQENIPAGSTWTNAAGPLGEKVWYNALLRLAGSKGVGDYANSPSKFYSKESLLFLPGAQYPPNKLDRPFFAFAINTKLQRKDKVSKTKGTAKLSQITMPARTVAFLEEGLPGPPGQLEKGEPKGMAIQPAYEGECKTSGRSFVERYGGQGVITFLDGHAESWETKKILTSTGLFILPDKNNLIWTRTWSGVVPPPPEEDPNH